MRIGTTNLRNPFFEKSKGGTNKYKGLTLLVKIEQKSYTERYFDDIRAIRFLHKRVCELSPVG